MLDHVPRFVLSLALSAAGLAQTTYIVDVNGGGQFTRIGDAIAVAVDGDTILVRPGAYFEGWTTGKSIQIVGDPGAVIARRLLPLTPGVTITGVAAGKRATLRGFAFEPGFASSLVVADCPGGVHFEDLSFGSIFNSSDRIVRISNCAQVSVTNATVAGFQPVTCVSSGVSFVNCDFRETQFVSGNAALFLCGCEVSVVGGIMSGGPAAFSGGNGIKMVGGRLTLAGATTVVRAGGGGVPAAGILAVSGEVVHEPAVTVLGSAGGPPFDGGATVITRRVPSVVASRSAPSRVHAALHAPQGSAFCLFAGLVMPTTPTVFGDLWFDLTAHVAVACGAIDASETFVKQIGVGSLPPGLSLALQGAFVRGAILELGTAAIIVVE